MIDKLPEYMRAPAWMMASCCAYTAMWALIRVVSTEVHSTLMVFTRYLVGTGILLLLHRTAFLDVLRTPRFKDHLKRSTSGIIGATTLFYAISHAPMAQVLAINYSAPLFATVGAVMFMGERIRLRRVVTLLVGFAGVLIVLRPGQLPLTPGIAAAVVAALAIATASMSIRHLVGIDRMDTVVAWGFVMPLPFVGLMAIPFWTTPSVLTVALMVGIGCLAYLGQICTTNAIRLAEAATAVMPYDFLRFALTTVVGVWLFSEKFDAYTLFGGGIIFASTIYLAYREAVAARAKAQD